MALTYGGLVTFESCLRHFAYGPRKSAAKAKRSRLERLLRYDKRTITYFDCYYPLIQDLAISEGERASLRQAVRRRKFYFFLERIGRLLFIYKIYWHFVKKYTFRTVSSYCHPNLS